MINKKKIHRSSSALNKRNMYKQQTRYMKSLQPIIKQTAIQLHCLSQRTDVKEQMKFYSGFRKLSKDHITRMKIAISSTHTKKYKIKQSQLTQASYICHCIVVQLFTKQQKTVHLRIREKGLASIGIRNLSRQWIKLRVFKTQRLYYKKIFFDLNTIFEFQARRLSIIYHQSQRSGVVNEYLDPYISAATAATYPPFLNSVQVKATLRASQFLPNFNVPSLELNYTFIVSPGPNPELKSVPVLLDPFLSLPVENNAYPSLISENAFLLTSSILSYLIIPILKQLPCIILISQQYTLFFYITKSAKLFLQMPVDVRTCTEHRESLRN